MKLIEFCLVVSDAFKTDEAREVMAGIVTLGACVIVAELILAMF